MIDVTDTHWVKPIYVTDTHWVKPIYVTDTHWVRTRVNIHSRCVQGSGASAKCTEHLLREVAER